MVMVERQDIWCIGIKSDQPVKPVDAEIFHIIVTGIPVLCSFLVCNFSGIELEFLKTVYLTVFCFRNS